MKSHSFIGKDNTKPCIYFYSYGPNDKRQCGRSYKDHSDEADCEACEYTGPCEFHVNSNMLLCPTCYDKQVQALLTSLETPNEARTKELETQKFNKEIEIVAKTPIRHSGDFYNAIVTSHMDLKRMIENDDSITDKQYAFQDAMTLRYKAICDALFPIEEQAYKLNLEKVVIAKTMREFGEELRKDIRERLRESDNNYIPPTPKIVKKPKLEKKSPAEILIETIAKAKGCSYTEAKLIYEKGGGLKA